MVAPGFFPSKLAAGLIDRLGGTTELEESNPRKRLGEPEDIAGVMIYLCSPAGSYMYEIQNHMFLIWSTDNFAEMALILVLMAGWFSQPEGTQSYEPITDYHCITTPKAKYSTFLFLRNP